VIAVYRLLCYCLDIQRNAVRLGDPLLGSSSSMQVHTCPLPRWIAVLELGVVRPSALTETRDGGREQVGTRAVWTQIKNVRYQITGSHRGIVEDSSVFRRDAVLGWLFPTFRRFEINVRIPSKRLESHIQRHRGTSQKV